MRETATEFRAKRNLQMLQAFEELLSKGYQKVEAYEKLGKDFGLFSTYGVIYALKNAKLLKASEDGSTKSERD